MNKLFSFAAGQQTTGLHLARIGLVIVLLWIGGLKAFRYEAVGIVPFVANNPTMNFFYSQEAPVYKQYMNREGEFKPKNIAWHEENNTYIFSYALGAVIVLIGLLIAVYRWWPAVSAFGSFLAFLMSLVTLSFLITTPETWVPALGDSEHGFPYLSAAGRLVVKDVIMMGAAIATMAQAARTYLQRKTAKQTVAYANV
jgi:reactive chlorine resistance protein C